LDLETSYGRAPNVRDLEPQGLLHIVSTIGTVNHLVIMTLLGC